MRNRIFTGLAMLISAFFFSALVQAAEPTLDQVYRATAAGHLNEAQAMMSEVLQAHPNSGKAHFVEAEVLAKRGLLPEAKAELTKAEQLSPGLTFAQPQSVQALHALVNANQGAWPSRTGSQSSGLWIGFLAIGLVLALFIAWVVRLATRRNMIPVPVGGNSLSVPYGTGMPPNYAGNYGVGQSSGLGSQVMGGLATGAAVGAGMVAGEALMHHFIGGNTSSPNVLQPDDWTQSSSSGGFDDLGGNDFGIADTSSWDDGSSGSDWN